MSAKVVSTRVVRTKGVGAKGLRWAAAALVAGLVTGHGLAFAQATPVGTWRTIDDETKKERSTVRIIEANGVLTGRIENLPDTADRNAVCDQCTDQRKGAKIIGLTIIEGVSNGDGDEYWDGGKILDPNNGKTYSVRLSPIDNGRKLQVRGYIGPFFRTQVWERVD